MFDPILLRIRRQPDDRTCGATCLHALYTHYADEVPLERLVTEVPQIVGGGTLGVHLANHALRRGYGARIYTYNLQLFDPFWFQQPVDLREKLVQQREQKTAEKLGEATDAYLEFLSLGGEVRYEDLTVGLIRRYLDRGTPILTGLSATYLYQSAREEPETDTPDDVIGVPVGHFVVLRGLDEQEHDILVADPYAPNPVSEYRYYQISVDRVLGAILLGILTYDANVLIIAPRTRRGS